MSSKPSLTPGTLLVAPPTLRDPNFRRTVVLLCTHDPGSSGSFGLILNRPLRGVDLEDVLVPAPPGDFPLALGGPVQPDTLHYLHRCGEAVPGARPLVEAVHWGGDFEVLQALLQRSEVHASDVRFFLGYAGWGLDQLETEVEAGGWLVTDAHAAEVFDEKADALWRTVLRRMGGKYAFLANFPDDPRMN